MTDFCNNRTVKKSRKAHRCENCGEMIPAGSALIHLIGHWDGDFYDFPSHLDCHEAQNNMARENDYDLNDGVPWLRDMFDEYAMEPGFYAQLEPWPEVRARFVAKRERDVDQDDWQEALAREAAREAAWAKRTTPTTAGDAGKETI